MVFSRIFIKVIYSEYTNQAKEQTSVLIFGAGEAGVISKNSLDKDTSINYKVIAFIDDDKNVVGKKLHNNHKE